MQRERHGQVPRVRVVGVGVRRVEVEAAVEVGVARGRRLAALEQVRVAAAAAHALWNAHITRL